MGKFINLVIFISNLKLIGSFPQQNTIVRAMTFFPWCFCFRSLSLPIFFGLLHTDSLLGDKPIIFYDFLIFALSFEWRALESARLEIKHMDT